MKKVSKRIEFGKSRHNPNLYVPSRWFLDEEEVTEMEYYGTTSKTKLEDIGGEPADMSEYQEWQIKRSIINNRDGVDFMILVDPGI